MTRIVLFLVLFLAACASAPVVTRTEVREVPTIVVQRCIDAKDIPAEPKTNMNPEGDMKQKAAGAVLDLHELDMYIARLLALLNGCAS
jgi:PBP1b-binding outer membrane lipoprotein LpoB